MPNYQLVARCYSKQRLKTRCDIALHLFYFRGAFVRRIQTPALQRHINSGDILTSGTQNALKRKFRPHFTHYQGECGLSVITAQTTRKQPPKSPQFTRIHANGVGWFLRLGLHLGLRLGLQKFGGQKRNVMFRVTFRVTKTRQK